MKNVRLTTGHGVNESISNLLYMGRVTVEDIYDAVEDSKDGAELVHRLGKLNIQKFALDRETDEYVRLKSTDVLGNVRYLKAWK